MLKEGDKVRVRLDTNGGHHGYVGEKGYYADEVRAVFDDRVVLKRVSWVPAENCEVSDSPDALVTLKGREFKIRMLDRREHGYEMWWAMLPRGMEPLATGETYEEALRSAVEKLYWSHNA